VDLAYHLGHAIDISKLHHKVVVVIQNHPRMKPRLIVVALFPNA